MKFDPTSAGSYSTSDEGCRGDCYLVSPKPYPVPGYLRLYDDLRKALRESVDTCSLQQGVCWVLKRSEILPRCGQRGGRGECEGRLFRSGFAGLGNSGGRLWPEYLNPFPDAVRRNAEGSWTPVARMSENEGPALVAPDGCVLPIWQRVFYVGGMNNIWQRDPAPMTYWAAVQAAMMFSARQGSTRVIFGRNKTGKMIPVVYVDPGGIVQARQGYPEAPATQVRRMDEFEMRQALAASNGASIMPFGM